MTEKFAVFDVDGTLFKSSCLEKAIDVAIDHGVFNEAAFAEAQAKRIRWQQSNNEGLYQSYLHSLVGGFISEIVGVSVDQFNDVIVDMVDRHRMRLFGFTRALLASVQSSHTTVAISGSPQMIVEPFLQGVGFDRIIGSQFPTKDGVYTSDFTSTNKVQAFVEVAGADVTPDIVVGDTVGDTALMELASRPIAFNPSATLRNTAGAHNWPIVTENKDAVYQFIPTEEGYRPVFDRHPNHVLAVGA